MTTLPPPGRKPIFGNIRGTSKKPGPRIPIVVKFVCLSSVLVIVVISLLSLLVLNRQKDDFLKQLINQGVGLVQIAAKDVPGKLLAAEELSLFQLVNALSLNDPVKYALITDSHETVLAHTDIKLLGKPYEAPGKAVFHKIINDVTVSFDSPQDQALLLFEKAVTFQDIAIGTMRLALSQDIILKNMEHAEEFILLTTLISIAIGVGLSIAYSLYFSVPIVKLDESLKALSSGDFQHRVSIARNDELGDLGDAFNHMSSALEERYLMRKSLELATEVQQSLLPAASPEIPGLEICGRSIYCDQTGGDYFDYLQRADGAAGTLDVVIGDVSGHGISSALLMASARALIRQRAALPGALWQVVTDVNTHLCSDVENSGRFMTLFYLSIDIADHSLTWVRAGHEPGFLYRINTDTIDELKGPGMALGVDPDLEYTISGIDNPGPGDIIFLGTDGIWEATNPHNRMFGKEPLYEIIRTMKNQSTAAICDRIVNRLKSFRERETFEDDVTFVVIRITAMGGPWFPTTVCPQQI